MNANEGLSVDHSSNKKICTYTEFDGVMILVSANLVKFNMEREGHRYLKF